jgi:hypothetical protein
MIKGGNLPHCYVELELENTPLWHAQDSNLYLSKHLKVFLPLKTMIKFFSLYILDEIIDLLFHGFLCVSSF